MLKIELFNPETEETETFTENFVSSRHLRKAFEFYRKVEKEKIDELDQIDELITLVSNAFRDPRVNFDSILDGIESENLSKVLNDIILKIIGGEAKKKEQKENLKKVTK
ncbi:phage tail assembly chaperone G [Heyndrickxia ginsengihumi]|uniref:phage tail assembly chaperone G n=1 Tax=Heyndrickxia ginsengihumi TaxID=363870 RepID=UPI0004716703|nr:hypothetical protein [Heyndrickxia ginsengihumi]